MADGYEIQVHRKTKKGQWIFYRNYTVENATDEDTAVKEIKDMLSATQPHNTFKVESLGEFTDFSEY